MWKLRSVTIQNITHPKIDKDLIALSSNGCTMTKNSKRALVKIEATSIMSLIDMSNKGIFVLNALFFVARASIASIIISISEEKGTDSMRCRSDKILFRIILSS